MHRDLARDEALRTRFTREIEAVRRLDHPNIVKIFGAGEREGQPFIVLEFVPGTDLDGLIQAREPLSLEWKLDLLRQLCEGLHHAHRQGIIHRDVKPANIRVTGTGVLKVMDFGMARIGPSDLTERGHMLGSVQYVAPEQLRGEAVDRRSDVFSVGVVAYELLACRRPFDGASIGAVLTRVLGDGPRPAPLPRSAYSPELEQVVLKAIESEPSMRQQSLGELRAALRDAVKAAATRQAARRARSDRSW
jgi:serine/threonine-protein kinase